MTADAVAWASVREREVAFTSGFRVVPLVNAGGTAGACQVQQLEARGGGAVAVRLVWPGDAAHLALWQALMAAESDWGTALELSKGEEVV